MRLSITTPRGSVVDADVEELVAPSTEGEIGILPGHVALMAALKPGVLTYRAKDHAGRLAVGEGFVQVAPGGAAAAGAGAGDHGQGADRVLVLVDRAMPAAGVDRALAEQDLAKAEGELAAWKSELDGTYQALVVRRDWALARIQAAGSAGSA